MEEDNDLPEPAHPLIPAVLPGIDLVTDQVRHHQKPSDVPLWDIEYHPYMSHRSSVLQIVIFRYHLIQGEISTFLVFRSIFKSPI